jgi:RES domain-containing protein
LTLAFCELSGVRTIRLIPSARHKPPVLEKLARAFGHREQLAALEGLTSGRLIGQQKGVPGISPEALASGYGYSYINAAFAYTRTQGNRFNPPEWGAWYSAFSINTALTEVSYHLTRALEATGSFDNVTQYIELKATFTAEFCDLRDILPKPLCLHSDCDIAYPEGQKLAAGLRESGGNGIVYPSARDPAGTCLVAFWPGLVQDFQQGANWKLEWKGSREPSISQV